jgi:tRNA(Arg) A34 adenosine deaminase TadA
MTQETIDKLIRECEGEAQKAIDSGNPPFGCIITDKDGNIIGRAHNTQQTDTDPTAHAEINAMRKLGSEIKSRYLDGYIMFANASSCSMCMSGAVKAHIREFYFGAPPEQSMNPWITMDEVAEKSKNDIKVYGPILGDECAEQIAKGREVN